MAAQQRLSCPADITPALWIDYVDERLAAGIHPKTLDCQLSALQRFLHFLQDTGEPVCERLLRVERMDHSRPLPRDLPADQLRRAQAACRRLEDLYLS